MTFTPHILPSQNDEDGTSASASIATPSWPWLKGQEEWGRRQGVVVGEVGWLAGWGGWWGGWQGGWRAGSGGGPGQVAGRVRWRVG